MKQNVKLKGQLRLYIQWPAIMTLLLIAMDIWIFKTDRRAGVIMAAFVSVYAVIVFILYFYNKSLILADLVEFAAQYGVVQNTLLKELAVPYAITLEDGKIMWANDVFLEEFSKSSIKDVYMKEFIPDLRKGNFPNDEKKKCWKLR